MAEIPYGSASFRKLNPDLFPGELVRPKPESHQRRESQNQSVEGVPSSMGYRITIISIRKRLVDAHDNLRAAHKALCDRITEWIRFKSDSDPRLEWNYEQFTTRGRTGTIVLIERTR